MRNDLFKPNHGESGEIEATLVVCEDGDWSVERVTASPSDATWFGQELSDNGAYDLLNVDDTMNALQPGKYLVKLTLGWSVSPSTPESPEEWDGWTTVVSVERRDS